MSKTSGYDPAGAPGPKGETPVIPVTSVAGRIGDVVLSQADISGSVTSVAGRIGAVVLTTADVGGSVTSVAGRTGAIALALADIADLVASLAGKLGIGATAADSDKLGGVAAPLYSTTAQNNAAYASKAENGWVPLAQTALSSSAASISFASIPQTYENLRLLIRSRGTALTDILLRINGDSTTAYDYQVLSGNNTATSAFAAAAATSIVVGSHAAGAGQGTALDVFVPGYARMSSPQKILRSQQARFDGDTVADFYVNDISGRWRSTAAIASLTLTPGSGSFDAGTVATLYGIKGV